jgi:N-acetylglucosamine kinase-like BadF-type ATPase
MRRIAAGARVAVVNDALVALVAGVGDAPGVVVICGTGSIAYGRNRDNAAARAGGWGHVLGDEGSGYWIGRQALRVVTRAADGRGPRTALARRVLDHFGVPRASDLVTRVYEEGAGHPALAQLAREVQQARDEGDELATRILEQAAHELVKAARSVVDRLHLAEETFDFILSGGVFTGVPWLAEELKRRLPATATRSRVRRLEVEPALGAVHLALAEARGELQVPTYVT